MLVGSIASITAFLDVLYIIKYIRKFRQVKAQINLLKNTKVLNVSELLNIVKQSKQLKSNFYIVKGLMKANSSQQDKNILSLFLSTPINKKDPILQHTYDKIPYRNLTKLAQYKRPQQFKDIKFNLMDMNTNDVSVAIQGCQGSSITGALSQIKSLQIESPKHNKVLQFLIFVYDTMSNIFPFSIFKKMRKTGQNISYYGLLQDRFVLVAGNLQIKDNKLGFKNPKYITKQLSFILKRLKNKFKYYKITLTLLFILNLLLVFYLIKSIYTKYSLQVQATQNIYEDESVGPGQECIVCFVAPRNVVFKPCRHYGVCLRCYYKLGKSQCPICKKQITGIIKVKKID